MATERIELGVPALRRLEEGRYELGIMVDGCEVVIRSAATLADTADGAICAFFLPALAAGKRIVTEAALDRVLAENLVKAAKIANKFWSYSGPMPEAPLTDRTPTPGTGQFFTGGVDSFYTLRQNLDQIEFLVNVHGFDISLSDRERFARSHSLLARVAERLSLRLVSLETDLRGHPLFRSISWGTTHVTALAAMAHALSPMMSRIHLAGSDVPPPWGSHPSLDALWSSSAVQIVPDQENASRFIKVQAIADWEIVHDSLKVCWENRSTELNCGVCEKCVRTQAAFAAVGHLQDLQTFLPGDLIQRIDGVRSVSRHLLGQWRDIRDAISDDQARRAINRLLRRSAVLNPTIDLLKRFGLTRARLRRLKSAKHREVGDAT